MDSITLELVASVRNPFPSKKRKKIIYLKENTSIRALLLREGFEESELEFLIPIKNGTRTTHDQILNDNDHIWITLPIGGG
ncbi:MAG: MoaD/ThiS family protein [Candidatus Heimdallarchaeota archaeon]|nr:MoaD/ThiS family protein [Candidatus Heimdallarchaeota archaeon]